MAIATVKTNTFRVCNAQGPAAEVYLGARELWRVDGDNRWRVITCLRGVVWVTQERDLHDYVLEAGEMFIVTLPGSVLVQALEDASLEITPPLKIAPYVGDYLVFN